MTHHETPASETASRPAVAGGALRPAVILGGNAPLDVMAKNVDRYIARTTA